MRIERPPLPVLVLGGLHAAARRSAAAELLARVPGCVVIHDALGREDGLAERTLRDAGGIRERRVLRLVNDCACCALREEIVPRLRLLAASRDCRLAVVEAWDSVELQELAEVVATFAGGDLRLAGVITAIDPDALADDMSVPVDLRDRGIAAAPGDERTVAEVLAHQIEYANVLACAPSADADGLALVRHLNPEAQLVILGGAELARHGDRVFDVVAAAARVHPACARLPHDTDNATVASLTWHRHRPMHPERLYDALADLVPAAVRSRGRFWLATRPDEMLTWDSAGGNVAIESGGPWLATLSDADWDRMPATRRAAAALDWHPQHGDRCQQLGFVASALDREPLVEILDACLLTDEELALGSAHWRAATDPFEEFLDVTPTA